MESRLSGNFLTENQRVKIGKFLSKILRHNPESVGLILDKNGWVNVETFITAVSPYVSKVLYGKSFSIEMLSEIVVTNNKKRYSYSDDGKKIRANQGHSMNVDVELKEKEPPERLYHGTAKKTLSIINQSGGLEKMRRLHVHLSATKETATQVGGRHGSPVVLIVNAKDMYNNGHKFYLSENKVWLTDSVPIEYIIRECEL